MTSFYFLIHYPYTWLHRLKQENVQFTINDDMNLEHLLLKNALRLKEL